MKKIATASVIIIIALILYFLCNKPDDSDSSKTSLLTDTPADTTNSDTDTRQFDEPDIGYDSTSRRTEERRTIPDDVTPAVEDTVTFRVLGEYDVNTYKSIAAFTKISVSPEFTGYLANFAGNIGNINVSNQSTYKHVISILLPTEVTPGTFNERSQPFIFQFFGSESGVLYTLDQMCPFSFTIDEWGGPGGRAKGTFSGELKAAEGSTIISIRDGSFDVGIK